jgi:hypothetical protein
MIINFTCSVVVALCTIDVASDIKLTQYISNAFEPFAREAFTVYMTKKLQGVNSTGRELAVLRDCRCTNNQMLEGFWKPGSCRRRLRSQK